MPEEARRAEFWSGCAFATPALGSEERFEARGGDGTGFTVLATGLTPRSRRPVRFDIVPEVLARLKVARADEFERTGRRLTALTQVALDAGGHIAESGMGVLRIQQVDGRACGPEESPSPRPSGSALLHLICRRLADCRKRQLVLRAQQLY